MKTKTVILFLLFLYIQSTLCETGTKHADKRHKSKKAEKPAEELNNAELPSPKRPKSTQRPKIKPTKTAAPLRQNEVEMQSPSIADEAAIENPSLAESTTKRKPKAATASTITPPSNISITDIDYERGDVMPPLVQNDCNFTLQTTECNKTISQNATNPEKMKKNYITISRIQADGSNETVNISLPEPWTKSNGTNDTTTTIDIAQDASDPEIEIEDKIEPSNSDTKITDASSDSTAKFLDAKKKKKIIVRKPSIKRRVSKKSKAKAKKEKRAKKAKIGPTSLPDIAAIDSDILNY